MSKQNITLHRFMVVHLIFSNKPNLNTDTNYHKNRTEAERPASTARLQLRAATNLADDIHADSGRVHAVVMAECGRRPRPSTTSPTARAAR
jgi:hypothetical protein